MDRDQILDRQQPPQPRPDHNQTNERGRYAAASAAFKRGLKVPELA